MPSVCNIKSNICKSAFDYYQAARRISNGRRISIPTTNLKFPLNFPACPCLRRNFISDQSRGIETSSIWRDIRQDEIGEQRERQTRGSFTDQEIKRGRWCGEDGESENRMKRHDRHATDTGRQEPRLAWGRHYVRPPFGPPLIPNDVPGK